MTKKEKKKAYRICREKNRNAEKKSGGNTTVYCDRI
jgi:hypothetical protein